ncbi:hypothetical protein FCT18_19695 [Lysinibacillus sphaericus]|uniref:PBSX prophage murein binding protein n=1 Tax=Lysinibacillus sphaericus TaxID=1421 RepID=A0A2S0K5K0_LYSSH|nr:hypothetical protein [Lysinibacillus sphaericus]AVK98640.1 hypothetical protein LS41612_21105 [Lysinibacillus sphaericus]MED4546462.1 hypothetical protein [Lysinibacillus sphaericus]TKI16827.1 hypothetical protein FCT18_19695 [Lysinibacillus sphaericus]SUV15376.1 PBSX prophage murein binding protein [Lysinibacillus sphaericus]
MDIFLSTMDRKQIIQLPIVPASFKIPSPVNNEVFTTINQGDIKLLGRRGLKSLTIDSFFPSKVYPFSRNNKYFGWEYYEIIEGWIDKRMPIRLIMSNTPINMLVTIENFEPGLQDGSGDVYYSLALSEFKEIILETKKVK